MTESSSYLHLLRKFCTVLRMRCLTRVRRRVEAPARRSPTPNWLRRWRWRTRLRGRSAKAALSAGTRPDPTSTSRHCPHARWHCRERGPHDAIRTDDSTSCTRKGKTHDRRRHLECCGQTPVGREQPGHGRHRRRGRRGYADDPRILQGMAGRYPYNLIRSRCYFVRYRFKDFDISIPDRIRTNVSACVEWPSKAVRTLADLSVFDGWDLGGIDPYGVRGLADETSLELVIPQAIVSAYMHGCAFLTITKDAEGVIVTPSGIQRRHLGGRHNRLAAVLTINDVTSKGRITAFNVFFPNTLLPIRLRDIGHRDDPRRLRRRRNPQGAIGGELRIGHAHRHPAVQRIRGIRACRF